MKAMKDRPPSRVQASGSMPSVKEQPRRRIRSPSLCSKVASRMCAVAGMAGCPSGPLATKSGVVNSPPPVSGAPQGLGAADDVFLVEEVVAVQFSTKMQI